MGVSLCRGDHFWRAQFQGRLGSVSARLAGAGGFLRQAPRHAEGVAARAQQRLGQGLEVRAEGSSFRSSARRAADFFFWGGVTVNPVGFSI